jgi:hypothetical protein
VQALHRNTAPEQDQKKQVAQRHSPGSLCDLNLRAAAYRWVEQFDFAGSSQPSRKIDIFHQRNGSAATNAQKMFASHENALVAINCSKRA